MNKFRKYIATALVVSFVATPLTALAAEKKLDCIKDDDGTFLCVEVGYNS